MSTPAPSVEGTMVEQQWTMKRSNSESSEKNYTSGRMALIEKGVKLQSSRSGIRTSETALVKLGAGKPNMVHNQKREEVHVKYCTSVHMQQTRSSNANNFKSQSNECVNMDASHTTFLSEPDVQKGACATENKSMRTQLEELANELRTVVQATQSIHNAPEGVGRCEEVLLKLSQVWLECKSATMLQQKGLINEEADSVAGKGSMLDILDDLTHELIFILANSELQEAQHLALCLLSACIGTRHSHSNESIPLSQYDYDAETRGECYKSNTKPLPSDPNVLHALSHLLQQQGRLPEAALLLHLLHPAQYSASCPHFLPHLLPLLLDLAQRNTMPTTQNTFDHVASTYSDSFKGHLHLIGESLKPRALALMMMSRLLAAVDQATRLQACKHVLFPNINALPCLLHSLDCAPGVDERIAAAFILATCMQADESCRQHIVNHVKLPFVVDLLQQSAANSNAFRTAVNFVSELLRARKANIAELLSSIRQDGLLNCMHALMAYLQTASLENQPPAAGLLLQLDLLLGDEHRYSVFREEALEALLSPLLKGSNREAIFNAVHVLSTIGRNHSQQELEAWLLKKAVLGATFQEGKLNTSSTAIRTTPASKEPEQEEEEESTMGAEWDEKVACALIEQGGGGLVSNALSKGLKSSMAEVRRACLLVTAWLTSHMRPFHRGHSAHSKHSRLRRDQSKASAKTLMRKALQVQLQDIAAVGSGCAIVERVFAAFALQNLTK